VKDDTTDITPNSLVAPVTAFNVLTGETSFYSESADISLPTNKYTITCANSEDLSNNAVVSFTVTHVLEDCNPTIDGSAVKVDDSSSVLDGKVIVEWGTHV
jgi:hypothetical protein